MNDLEQFFLKNFNTDSLISFLVFVHAGGFLGEIATNSKIFV